jgi:outer membrane receptor for ferrienterochelin and colicins
MLRHLGLYAMAASLMLMLSAKPFAQRIDTGALQQLFDESVTTSATGKPQRASDAPADIEIITADDIRRSGADNLPDVLRFVAGLDVRRYGFAAADVGVRGYNETSNPRLLVLLDGQQVYLDDLGRTQWYTLPVILSEIKQIEVIKGPNTALFGFNAASGVINIITYDPLYDRPLNVAQVYTGTQDYARLSAVGTGRIGDKAAIRALSTDSEHLSSHLSESCRRIARFSRRLRKARSASMDDSTSPRGSSFPLSAPR